jgi:tripartite-type tricarboxylate transporter receptor subunit TctC
MWGFAKPLKQARASPESEQRTKALGTGRLKRAAWRSALALVSVCAATFAADRAGAQDFPSKPIRIIVPYPPGAITDTTGRMIAADLSKVIGQTVIVENRGGGGTVVGTQAAKTAPADGYTILYQLNALATNVYSLKNPGYALSDFKPVAMFGEAAFVVVSSQQAKFKTMQELIAWGKANPGKLNLSATGDGAQAVISNRLKQATGVDWTQINYRGGAESVQAVMAGDVDFSLPTQSAPLIYANPDKLKILAITSKKRLDTLPDVPTFAELGYAIDEKTWFGLFVRSETPPAVVEKLKSALAEVFNAPSMKAQLSKLRVSPYEGKMDDVPVRLQQELDDFSKEARKLGLEPQ